VLGPAAAVFSLLLVLTGAAKVRHPEYTSRALAGMFGRSMGPPVGVGIGLFEVALGVAGLLYPTTEILSAQAVTYFLFAIWIGAALAKGLPIETCGCLGTPDTPPYWGHLALNLLATVASVGAASAPTAWLPGGLLEAVATLLTVSLGAFLAWIMLGDGARLHGAIAR